jgi:hypothetical protein
VNLTESVDMPPLRKSNDSSVSDPSQNCNAGAALRAVSPLIGNNIKPQGSKIGDQHQPGDYPGILVVRPSQTLPTPRWTTEITHSMGSILATSPSNRVEEILSRVLISEVYRALCSSQPRRTGTHSFRGPATWRGGDGPSVSLDDSRGVWHDFVSGQGGGVLDLIIQARGGSRADALRWAAVFSGVTLQGRPLSPSHRERQAQERREAEYLRQRAAHFAAAARQLAEMVLENLRATDPERAVHTALLRRLAVSPEAEYQAWCHHDPVITGGLVHAGRERELRLARMIVTYITAEVPRAT